MQPWVRGRSFLRVYCDELYQVFLTRYLGYLAFAHATVLADRQRSGVQVGVECRDFWGLAFPPKVVASQNYNSQRMRDLRQPFKPRRRPRFENDLALVLMES